MIADYHERSTLTQKLALADPWSWLALCVSGIFGLAVVLAGVAIIYVPIMWLCSLYNIHFGPLFATPISGYALGTQLIFSAIIIVVIEPVALLFGYACFMAAIICYYGIRTPMEQLLQQITPGTSRPFLQTGSDTPVQSLAIAHFVQNNDYTYVDKPAKSLDGTIFVANRNKTATLLFEGHTKAIDMAWYTLGTGKYDNLYDILRVSTKEFLPHTIINSSIGSAKSLVPARLAGAKKMALEGDAGKFLTVYSVDSQHIESLQLLSPDVLLAMLEKTPLSDIELLDQHIDFVWSHSADTSEMRRRIAAAEVITRELEHQLQGKASFQHPFTARMRIRRQADHLVTFLDRMIGWTIVSLIFGIILLLFFGILIPRNLSTAPAGLQILVYVILAIPFIMICIGLIYFAIFVYTILFSSLLGIPETLKLRRLTSEYFLDYQTSQ